MVGFLKRFFGSKKTYICVKCGEIVDPSDNFCKTCGKKLVMKSTCASCGKKRRQGDKFCYSCGFKHR